MSGSMIWFLLLCAVVFGGLLWLTARHYDRMSPEEKDYWRRRGEENIRRGGGTGGW